MTNYEELNLKQVIALLKIDDPEFGFEPFGRVCHYCHADLMHPPQESVHEAGCTRERALAILKKLDLL